MSDRTSTKIQFDGHGVQEVSSFPPPICHSRARLPNFGGQESGNPVGGKLQRESSELDPRFRGGDKTESQLLLSRSFFYRMIADLFRHPSDGEISNRISEYLRDWPLALEKFPLEGQKVLRELLKQLTSEIEKIDVTEWVSEIESCFGHTAFAAVPAYEIEYGEEHSHRQPQELADIAAFYNAFGLRLSKSVRERVDHVSVECEFMSFLLHKEAYAIEQGDAEKLELCRRSSSKFFSEHLGRWFPAFTHRLLRRKSQGIIRSIAEFALVFITEEARRQDLLAGQMDLPVRRVDEAQETGCISCLSKPDLA